MLGRPLRLRIARSAAFVTIALALATFGFVASANPAPVPMLAPTPFGELPSSPNYPFDNPVFQRRLSSPRPALSPIPNPTPQPAAPDRSGTYEGTINGATVVALFAPDDATALQGHGLYAYRRYGRSIALQFVASAPDVVDVEELRKWNGGESGNRWRVRAANGSLTGEFAGVGSAARRAGIALHRIAKLDARERPYERAMLDFPLARSYVQRSAGELVVETDPRFGVSVPTLRSGASLGVVARVDAALESEFTERRIGAFACEESPAGSVPVERTSVTLFTARLFAIETIDDSFCGGPHPNLDERDALTFDLRDGSIIDWPRILNAHGVYDGVARRYLSHARADDRSPEARHYDLQAPRHLREFFGFDAVATPRGLEVWPTFSHAEAIFQLPVTIPYAEIAPLLPPRVAAALPEERGAR